MNADDDSSIKVGIFKHKEDYTRLHLPSLLKECPEIGLKSQFLIERTRDLEAKLHRDSEWSMSHFHRLNMLTIYVSTIPPAVILLIILLSPKPQSATVLVIGGLGYFAAVMVAAVKSYGWHRRYGAIFTARWELTAMRVRLEQEIILLALDECNKGALSDNGREKLGEILINSVEQLEKIMLSFGKNHANAIEGIDIPKFSILKN
jgi:hypothetical protein